ncbi:MAG TPA: hypothetical protein DIU15_19575 [Deltaproteobacteria bacterium]|nr:hypothetical protein [Deltaproteobacteria bacterium]HCP48249.1 hypothetical protein [Deltaproteobacteria bacterium]
MPSETDPGPLEQVLQETWEAALRLPDDDSSFDSLSPTERRRAHDLGVRVQDRVTRALARLVEGMARDGAELVDEAGLSAALKPE